MRRRYRRFFGIGSNVRPAGSIPAALNRLEPRGIHYRGMQNPSTALEKPSEILFQRAYQFCFVQAVVFQTAAEQNGRHASE